MRAGRKGAEEQSPALAAVAIAKLHRNCYLGTADGRKAKQEPALFLIVA